MSNKQFDEVNLVTPGGVRIELLHADTDLHIPPVRYGYWLGPNARFSNSPKLLYSERLRANIPGSQIDIRQHRPLDIVLPITVRTPTAEELPAAIAELFEMFDPITSTTWASDAYALPTLNPTTIEVLRAESGATTRTIEGHLVAGSDVTWTTTSAITARVPLMFRCPFPYWAAGAEVTESVTLAASSATGVGDWNMPATASDLPMWPTYQFNFADPKTSGDLDINQQRFNAGGDFLEQDVSFGFGHFTYVTRPDIRSAVDTLSSSAIPSSELYDMFTPAPIKPGETCELTLINGSDAEVEAICTIQPLALTP